MGRALWILGSLLLRPALGAAQSAASSPTPAVAPGIGGTAVVVAILVGLAVFVGLAYAAHRRRSWDDMAFRLQVELTDALLRDRTVGTGVTARVEMRARSPVHIELVGPVPTEQARTAAVRTVEAEAARRGLTFVLEDRMTVTRAA